MTFDELDGNWDIIRCDNFDLLIFEFNYVV